MPIPLVQRRRLLRSWEESPLISCLPQPLSPGICVDRRLTAHSLPRSGLKKLHEKLGHASWLLMLEPVRGVGEYV